MSPDSWDLADCVERLNAFREARDWARFHVPKELAAALAIEAGELQETMLWKSHDEVRAALDQPEFRRAFEAEVADVAICLLMLAERTGIPLRETILAKIDSNERDATVGFSALAP